MKSAWRKDEDAFFFLGWKLRFLHNCEQSENNNYGELDASDLIKRIQKESFHCVADEFISSLIPFEDEHGILRIKTRISEHNDTFEYKHPAVLPAGHLVVLRLVYRFNVQSNHVGAEDLLSMLREKFWILRGRRMVHSVIHNHMQNIR
ncbi:hypothetical protein PR048_007355 [Dryococelus australis]|uniref:Uncharacterized protein n=1 Tax=Dryococelus australis TaxID=614101 RepID=A0ABQ9IDF0_9NEOP|nr:hypothetical protein PR048_007355 [Dryococelus australis]